MTYRYLIAALMLALLLLSACDVDIDAPQTPTIVISPTLDETAIARLATTTPTLTRTPSTTPTSTHTATDRPIETTTGTYTHTPTQTPSATPTYTLTASPTRTIAPTATVTRTNTPTQTPSATLTYTLTASPTRTVAPTATATRTDTPTRTQTHTATPTDTARPVPTLTRSATPTDTWTPRPSATPTEPIAQLAIPTATARATQTFTPFPSITPNQTATWVSEHITGPTPTPTPGGIYTLAPTATLPPTLTPNPMITATPSQGGGTFYDPNAAPAEQTALPVAPEGDSGPIGALLPEQQYIVVSYAGQVVPLLDVPNLLAGSSSPVQGNTFAVRGDAEAYIGHDRMLYVNRTLVIVSPASEFGLHENLSYGELAWSPDGQRLAMRVDAADPGAFNGIDSGIWVYEPATNGSWQVFRNTYQGAQLHEQRRAVSAQWAPNGAALIVSVETPLGRGNVLTPVGHNANQFIDALPYADATWATDSNSVIVSGYRWGATTVIGRVVLDAGWTYTEYLNQQTTGLVMQHAIELANGQVAFLGGLTPDSFALYIIQPIPGASPVRLSPEVRGQIMSAEWRSDRTAVLVIAQVGGMLRLWVIRVDGTAQDVTPAAGAPTSAHWR